MKIAIIGASIAGSTAYQCLSRVFAADTSVSIDIYEKSNSNLADRGVGITLPDPLVNKLVNCNLIPGDHKSCFFDNRSGYINQDNKSNKIWQQDFATCSFNWGVLYQYLSQNIPSNNININYLVTNIFERNNKSVLEFSNGKSDSYDLVIGADGYDSIIIKSLYPQNKSKYLGLVAWRGLCSIQKLPVELRNTITKTVSYYLFDCGHLIAYPISTKKGLVINWVLYEQKSEEQADLLSESYKNNIWTKDLNQYLKDYSSKYLSDNILDLIELSDTKLIQKIHSSYPNTMATKNSCLVGDAAAIVPPPVGSGAVKAIEDAVELLNWNKEISIAENLSLWQEKRLPAHQTLVYMGDLLVDKFIVKPPSWNKFNQILFDKWFVENINIQIKNWYFTKSQQAEEAIE